MWISSKRTQTVQESELRILWWDMGIRSHTGMYLSVTVELFKRDKELMRFLVNDTFTKTDS